MHSWQRKGGKLEESDLDRMERYVLDILSEARDAEMEWSNFNDLPDIGEFDLDEWMDFFGEEDE
jgi:hypothetical protein